MLNLLSRLLLIVVGFVGLIAFSVLGEMLSSLMPISIPGPLIGMLLLFAVLVALGDIPAALASAAKPILGHMSLLFVPAILGVWHYQALIQSHWLALSVVVVFSTIVALAVTAWVAEKSLRKHDC